MPLGLTAAALVTHASIKKNIFGSNMTTLIFSNEELNDVMKLVKFLEYKNKKEDFQAQSLGMITDTLGASLLRNMLADRGMKSKIAERNAIITGLGVT